jgi:PHD/YefM family antitoxin component YafN of YafNO toxin-antitoxin module
MAKIAKENQGGNEAMHVTATQAKNRFGAICTQAKTAPVFVEKDGKLDTVILSARQFEALQAASHSPAQKKAQFEKNHQAWLAEQNARFEQNGLWCDDLRVW